MAEQFTHKNKRSLLHFLVGALLTVFGAVLALSGLMAETAAPTPKSSAECKQWPPCKSDVSGDCHSVREKVKSVFATLIDDASVNSPDGKRLREKLIDGRNGYHQARLEVRKRLQRIKIPFEDAHTVIFYEPEDALDSPEEPGTMANYPNNHCLHVFYLLDMPTRLGDAAPKATFEKHLMCCYQPWKSEKAASPTPLAK